jgi:hypothetical protein
VIARRRHAKRKRWPPETAKLTAPVEEAIFDAYGDSEQRPAGAEWIEAYRSWAAGK